MQSKNTDYLERLDHLRFAAAALVALFHAALFLRTTGANPAEGFNLSLIEQGHIGVQLFMVISGFILGRISRDKDIVTSRFYLNRVLRIYPLYILVVALGHFASADIEKTHNVAQFFVALTPFSNLARLDYGQFGGVLWSIAVELQFYLLFPLIHRLHRDRGVAYLVALGAFFMFMRWAVFQVNGTVHNLSYFSLFGAMDLFLVGIGAGTYFDRLRWTIAPRWVLLAAFAAINILVWLPFRQNYFSHVATPARRLVMGQNGSWLWIIWPELLGIAFTALILAYVQLGNGGRISRAFAWCGKLSYSMYIWHYLVILIVRQSFVGSENWTVYACSIFVVLPLTMLVSAASYYVIERPFLGWRVVYTRTPLDNSVRAVT